MSVIPPVLNEHGDEENAFTNPGKLFIVFFQIHWGLVIPPVYFEATFYFSGPEIQDFQIYIQICKQFDID